jgi:hypothetical protein
MLKRIPKSDISIRPFKAYKEWDKASAGVTLLEALNGNYTSNDANTITTGLLSGSVYNKYSVFGQLSAQFYNGKENDPINRLGSKTNVYNETNPERFLSGSAKVISIPQNCIGEGIKKGSVLLIDGNIEYVDDKYSNLILSGSTSTRIGNVFYNQGLVVITSGSNSKLTGSWDISFKSTQTIYENEFLLIVNPDEFNFSTNPTSVETIGMVVTSSIELYDKSNPNSKKYIKKIITNTGTQYVKKKSITSTGTIVDYRFSGSVGNIRAGFEHYELSSSVDTTGSFLTPMITTIGLYNDACELLAVAKLPQPIKSEPDIPVNFIVRFDT